MLEVLSTAPLAVVEIESEWALLVLAAAVFLVVLAVVLAVAYLFMHVKRKPGHGGTSTFEVNLGGRVPVSKTTFDRLEKVTVAAFSRPEVTPEKRAYLDRLSRLRASALKMSRILLLFAGLGGLVIAVALWRDATTANMQLLPASIILLLSVGALLSAWVPSRSLGSSERIEPGLLERINVQVLRPEPTTLTLTEADIERFVQFTRQGLSPERAAQAAYPDFERLDEAEKQTLLLGLEKSVKAARSRYPL